MTCESLHLEKALVFAMEKAGRATRKAMLEDRLASLEMRYAETVTDKRNLEKKIEHIMFAMETTLSAIEDIDKISPPGEC